VRRKTDVLRPATPEDAPAICALTCEAYAKWIPLIGREPLPMTVDYAQAVRFHRFDLLEREGSLIALVEIVLDPNHLWIENLAISPAHQSQGLGQAMLRHVEAIARSLGHTRIRLRTNRAFVGNLAFYQRAGFVIEREEPFTGGVTVFFCKTLNSGDGRAKPGRSS
jgi:GNAT superfamily N-acetyltransferase